MESKGSDNQLWMLESSLKKRKSKQVITPRKLQQLFNEPKDSQSKAKRSLMMKQKKATSQSLASAFVIPPANEKISLTPFQPTSSTSLSFIFQPPLSNFASTSISPGIFQPALVTPGVELKPTQETLLVNFGRGRLQG